MAGTYAHFMVSEKARQKVKSDASVPKRTVLRTRFSYVLAGAVGPDYPYLVLVSDRAKEWANRMHHRRTKDFICTALETLRQAPDDMALAWLLGYVAHVVVDVVIHPVVNAIVGPYAQNMTAHRLCEMTEDTYIFKKVKGFEVTSSEYSDRLWNVSDPDNDDRIHPSVERLWRQTLKTVHGDYAADFPPRINLWHKRYINMMDVADARIALFRHMAQERALLYCTTDETTPENRQRYIEELKVPGTVERWHYDDLFKKATDKVIEAWSGLLDDYKNNTGWTEDWVKDWSLDTGIILGEGQDATPYFWK